MGTRSSFNFTKAYEELERIVAAFEAGHVDLERDLPKFERGLQLASVCRTRLRELENHVRKIEKAFQVEEAQGPPDGDMPDARGGGAG